MRKLLVLLPLIMFLYLFITQQGNAAIVNPGSSPGQPQIAHFACTGQGACVPSSTGNYLDPNCLGQCSPPATGGGGASSGGQDECYNAACQAGTYCGGSCGVTGNPDNLYSCTGTCTGAGSGCHRAAITYCGVNNCQRNIVGGDICKGNPGSTNTGAPSACGNNGGNCLNPLGGVCPNHGATLPYSCTGPQQTGGICCSSGGDIGAGGNGGGNVSAGVQCGSTQGSCANQTCSPTGPGFCEDNTNICSGSTKVIKVYKCQYAGQLSGHYVWTFAYNQTGGSKCYTNSCLAPSTGTTSSNTSNTCNTGSKTGTCVHLSDSIHKPVGNCDNQPYNPGNQTCDPKGNLGLICCDSTYMGGGGNKGTPQQPLNSADIGVVPQVNASAGGGPPNTGIIDGPFGPTVDGSGYAIPDAFPDSSRILFASSKVLAATAYKIPIHFVYDKNAHAYFNHNVSLANIPAGKYLLYVHLDKTLDAQLIQENDSQSTLFPFTQIKFKTAGLLLGDISPLPHGDNTIDIQDYNAMVSCLNGQTSQTTCVKIADLNGDGKVDKIDLQILMDDFGIIGASPFTPTFTCVTDPACTKTRSKTLQLCPLKCSKQIYSINSGLPIVYNTRLLDFA